MDLSIIIVNWNVCDLLRRCLTSIQTNQGDLLLEVIVVDNASIDDSVVMVRREFPGIRLIASQENLGYTGGNNRGAYEATGRYLLIFNPDTEIVGQALQRMVAYLDEQPQVGVVGPQLLYPDGSIQSSRRRFPQLTTAFFSGTPLTWRFFPNNKFAREHTMTNTSDQETQPVDWLVGAALMIRREAWQEVGLFDEGYFMYFEEVDWCYRCRQAGWEIHYLPVAQIIHDEHKAANKVPITKQVRLNRSRIRYFRKHFGVEWALLIRIFLLASYIGILIEEVARWFIDRHETRPSKIKAYWQILKSI